MKFDLFSLIKFESWLFVISLIQATCQNLNSIRFQTFRNLQQQNQLSTKQNISAYK